LSYDIIYNKQFVKLRRIGEVIPMLLAGSNNCYEVGMNGRTGRRTRSWDNMRYYNRKGKISEKPEIILKNLDADLRKIIREQRRREDGGNPAHVKAHFGYYASIVVGSGHCADTSWDLYRSQFSNGIKNALTIEQLAELGVYLHFHYWDYGEQDTSEGRPASVDLTTEQQYFIELKKWRAWMEKHGKRPWLGFTPSDTDAVLRKLRATRRTVARKKEQVVQDHYFVLAGEDGYLMKYTRRGFRYTFSNNGGCKKFMTEKDVATYLKQLRKKGAYKADTWKAERVDTPSTFWV
jgi:hypothetical protein